MPLKRQKAHLKALNDSRFIKKKKIINSSNENNNDFEEEQIIEDKGYINIPYYIDTDNESEEEIENKDEDLTINQQQWANLLKILKEGQKHYKNNKYKYGESTRT